MTENRQRHAGGRPKAENPLDVDCKVRFDAVTVAKLDSYCRRHGVNRAAAIRRAVQIMLAADSVTE